MAICIPVCGLNAYPNARVMGALQRAELCLADPRAEAVYWDFVTVAEVAAKLAPESAAAAAALFIANEMINVFRVDEPETWAAARALAAGIIGKPDSCEDFRLLVVGNCHIDCAWCVALHTHARTRARTRARTGMYAHKHTHT